MKSNFLAPIVLLSTACAGFTSLPARLPTLLVPTSRRGEKLGSSALPASFNATAENPTLPGVSGSRSNVVNLSLLLRSSFCAIGSVATWETVQRLGLTIVQASAAQGLIGCIVLPKPFALAWLCGTFAGMSAHPRTLDEASLLALMCTGMFYVFEDKKLELGRGGRLGLIAFMSNLFYFAVRKGPRTMAGWMFDLANQIQPSTALGLACTGAFLRSWQMRTRRLDTNTPGVKQKTTAMLGLQSIMIGLLLKQLVASGVHVSSFMTILAATFSSAFLVWKSPYTVLSVALLGVLSGFATPSLAPAVYQGAFLGMCSLPKFGIVKFFKAAVMSTALLSLGILGGFGGRLGFLAYLGVNFAL